MCACDFGLAAGGGVQRSGLAAADGGSSGDVEVADVTEEAVVEADPAAMAEAVAYVAPRHETYHMPADDSSDGGIDAAVYEYQFNGGVMGYMSHAEALEEPTEGLIQRKDQIQMLAIGIGMPVG